MKINGMRIISEDVNGQQFLTVICHQDIDNVSEGDIALEFDMTLGSKMNTDKDGLKVLLNFMLNSLG